MGRAYWWVLAAVTLSCAEHAPADEVTTESAIYPYERDDGATVCGDGKDVGRPLEFYYFDRVNARIAGSPELQQLVAEEGLREISSCDDARRFNSAMERLLEREAANAPELPEPEPVDKIADGTKVTATHTVQLMTTEETCSGALINPMYVLTAAHCFAAGGWQHVSVIRNNSFIANGTLWVYIHPGWSGTTGDPDDMALVWSPDWDPPVGNESYLRILGRKLATGEKVELFGYGPNAHDGSGSAVHRRSNAIIGVDSSTTGTFGIKTVSGEGRICIGDSGGPAVATNGPYPLLAGVASTIQRSGSNKCPSPDQWQYFAQAGGGAVRQCADGNVAGDHSCWIAETLMNDPDTPWYNNCYRVVFQGYEMLKCWGWNF